MLNRHFVLTNQFPAPPLAAQVSREQDEFITYRVKLVGDFQEFFMHL